MASSTQCISCARYRGFGECAAYPDGIPPEVLSGDIDHTQPYPNDNGLQWVAQSPDDDLRDFALAYPDDPGVAANPSPLNPPAGPHAA